MKILNLYYSSTGNTEKVATRIAATAAQLGHEVDTVRLPARRTWTCCPTTWLFLGQGSISRSQAGPSRSLWWGG